MTSCWQMVSDSLTTSDSRSECWTEVMQCDSLRTIGRATTQTCTLTEVTGLNLHLWCVACSGETQGLHQDHNEAGKGHWDSCWSLWDTRCTCSLSKNWVCDKTKVAGIGTIALPNRPAESKTGGSGAAVAGWDGPAQLEVVLPCYIYHMSKHRKS